MNLHCKSAKCLRVYATMLAGAATMTGRIQLALFDDPHSLYCAKVKIALLAKNLTWETLDIPCGSTKSADYLKLAPLGKIPALIARCGSDDQVRNVESVSTG